jgi:hypothetical protein
LRIKRGHRKSAPGDPEAKEQSPSVARRGSQSPGPEADDAAGGERLSKGAFELYSKATRPELEDKARDQEDVNIDEELARGWKDLSDADKDKYIAEYKASSQPTGGEDRADSEKRAAASPAKEEGKDDGQEKEGEPGDKEEKPTKSEPRDEDVEMKDNDAEERETPVDKTRGDD